MFVITKNDKKDKKDRLGIGMDPTSQSFVINAATGITKPFRVGSEESTMMFIKSICFIPTKEIKRYFYDSPQQFMDFTGIKLDQNVINDWTNSRLNLKPKIWKKK
tara:strand:+ start:325 stop:639 length:315 start_codon:yes stop_codon:yes gene_type:complete